MPIDSNQRHAEASPHGSCLVIYNPAAGARRRRRLDMSLAVLRSRGVSVELGETAGPDDAEAMARDVEDRVAMVAVAGGDGTINGAINGLMARAESGRPVPPMGVLPLGTANVLAAELGLPTDPAAAAAVLADGWIARINLGRANGRYFSSMVGMGFDARIVERIGPSIKRLLGKGAYVLETLRELVAPAPERFRVAVGERTWDAAAVVVASGHYYGGRFILAPAASLTGEHLQVCIFQRSGRWAVIRYLVAMTLGLLPRLSDYRVVPAEAVSVAGPDGAPVQGDGDIIAHLPLQAEIVPRAIDVIVPAGSELIGRQG